MLSPRTNPPPPPFPPMSAALSRYLILGAALALTGCMVGPDYRRPEVGAQLPAEFKAPSGWKIAEPSDAAPKAGWWKPFGDARLDDLMDQAMANNQSLKAAFLRVEQARSLANAGRGGLFPGITYQPDAERSRRSATTRSNRPELSGSTTTNLRLPLVFGYEIDLWGKLRRQLQAADAEAQATAAGYQGAMLALQADLAINYYQLRALDREIAILGEAADLRKKSLGLIEKRFKAGDVDEVDVARAETEVSATESEILGLRKTRAEFENAIAVLTGAPSSGFRLPPIPLASSPPTIPGAVPSALLERRPDVAEAERQMQAANARIGVAQAAFFPAVRLDGSLGLESSSIDRLFRADSLTWGVGPALSGTIFDGGANEARLQTSRFRYEESVATYRQTVLDAVREVDDALAGIRLLTQQLAAQERTVAAAQRTVELSEKRYEAGLVAYFDVVDAQRTALDAQRAAARIQGSRHLASIALTKALGGGWRASE